MINFSVLSYQTSRTTYWMTHVFYARRIIMGNTESRFNIIQVLTL